MLDGVAVVLPFAVGVAVSPVPIIAVILMLFSGRAKVNGPVFLLGWAAALAVVSGVAFVAGDAASEDTTSDVVSWWKVFIGAAVAGLGLPTSAAVVSLAVFVVVASLTIAGPVLYYVVGGETARTRLDAIKDWLAVHNDAVMVVLFLVLGVDLIAQGIPPLM